MAIVVAVAYFLVAVVLHAGWCRLPPLLTSVPKFVLMAGATGAALAAHLWLVYGLSMATLAALLVYGLVVELYLFMATLVFGSVSAVWLRRLRRGRVSQEQMHRLYSPAWMVDTRLERLSEQGFIARGAGTPDDDDRTQGVRFHVTQKGMTMIRAFGRLRAFFGHDRRHTQQ